MAVEFVCLTGHTFTVEAPRPAEEVACPICHKRAVALDETYRADRAKIHMVRWLALILGLVVAFSAAPAATHLGFQGTPAWVWMVLFVAALQASVILWMLVTPDWSSLRVVTLLFILTAIGYGVVTVMATRAAPDAELPWGMNQVRAWAPRWCAAVLLVTALAAYLCAHAGHKWRRAFDLERAIRAMRRRRAP